MSHSFYDLFFDTKEQKKTLILNWKRAKIKATAAKTNIKYKLYSLLCFVQTTNIIFWLSFPCLFMCLIYKLNMKLEIYIWLTFKTYSICFTTIYSNNDNRFNKFKYIFSYKCRERQFCQNFQFIWMRKWNSQFNFQFSYFHWFEMCVNVILNFPAKLTALVEIECYNVVCGSQWKCWGLKVVCIIKNEHKNMIIKIINFPSDPSFNDKVMFAVNFFPLENSTKFNFCSFHVWCNITFMSNITYILYVSLLHLDMHTRSIYLKV